MDTTPTPPPAPEGLFRVPGHGGHGPRVGALVPPAADSAPDHLVEFAALRLLGYGPPLSRGVAMERARAILAAIFAGQRAVPTADEQLADVVPELRARAALAHSIDRIIAGWRDGWCDLALWSLATGRTVEVTVLLTTEEEAGANPCARALGLACALHRGLVEVRTARPEHVGPGRWLVRMRPWGTHC